MAGVCCARHLLYRLLLEFRVSVRSYIAVTLIYYLQAHF